MKLKESVTKSSPVPTGWKCPKGFSGFPICQPTHGEEEEAHPGDMPEVRRRDDTNFIANILPANKGELKLKVCHLLFMIFHFTAARQLGGARGVRKCRGRSFFLFFQLLKKLKA